MTPTLAGVALALAVRPDTPKSLTLASRKRSPTPPEKAHQGSRKLSPKPPGCAHRHVPQPLTDAPRKGSPTPPAGTHRPLPGRLTECSRIGSPRPSRRSSPAAPEKSHLLGRLEFSRLKYSGKYVWVPRGKLRCGSEIAANGTRLAMPAGCASLFPSRTGSDTFAVVSLTRPVRMPGIRDRKHPQRAGKPGTSTAYGVRTRRTADGRYGCSFILKPTTPGSSVVDTAKPHDFASAIIAEFSRSASPIIHAVPRERA